MKFAINLQFINKFTIFNLFEVTLIILFYRTFRIQFFIILKGFCLSQFSFTLK
jgi:hypothetical protein